MRREILFLKAVVILMGTALLALGIVGLPWLVNNPVNPEYARIIYPIIVGMYISAIPFYFVLYQALKLLTCIDQNIAFSELSSMALKKIKHSASAISILYVAIIPFVYFVAEKDDAPGLIIIGMVPILAWMVIAVFAAVLQKLVKNVIDR